MGYGLASQSHIGYLFAMARPKRYGDNLQAWAEAGTLDRIDSVLHEGQLRAEFIRGAVLGELEKAETLNRQKQPIDVLQYKKRKLNSS